MFVIINQQTKFLRMFLIFVPINFHVFISIGPLVIAVKLKHIKFQKTSVLLLYVLQMNIVLRGTTHLNNYNLIIYLIRGLLHRLPLVLSQSNLNSIHPRHFVITAFRKSDVIKLQWSPVTLILYETLWKLENSSQI